MTAPPPPSTEIEVTVTINRTTGAVEGIDRDTPRTLAEVAAITAACPRCGSAGRFTPVDMGSLEAPTAPRRFGLGRWSCPRGCDPTAP
jgi:hypothetical protein